MRFTHNSSGDDKIIQDHISGVANDKERHWRHTQLISREAVWNCLRRSLSPVLGAESAKGEAENANISCKSSRGRDWMGL